ncbi:right-handed parallel beta-helix repeat-containing protein [Kitasatospora sp. NPDC059327]|uniref:right-handed parallel beta-helix repeat-containing protein n=1 Tax=Kitasatospora sp. NPDC059327 TaxID=3346803 RepID=UPI0036C963BE
MMPHSPQARPRRRSSRRLLATTTSATLMALALAPVLSTPAAALTPSDPGAVNLYIATNGNDANAGTSETQAFLTPARAQTAARAASAAGKAVHVWARGGTYHLGATLNFTAADSGTASAPVTYSAYPGEQAVLSGGRRVQAAWSTYSGNTKVADVGKGLDVDGLFLNGQQQVLARYPNFAAGSAILNGTTNMSTLNSRSQTWQNPTTGLVRALHNSHWGGNDYKVTGRTSSALQLRWVGDNNRGSGKDDSNVVAENIFEELDAPGEWFHDKAAGKLYFQPPTGTDLSTAVVETAELNELVRIEGASSTAPVHDITFDGFTYTQTHRTLFNTPYEGLQLGDWAIARAGAIHTKNTERITVSNSTFQQVGGNGVFLDGYNKGDVVTRNRFTGSGASDVQVVGSRDAVRNPSTWALMVNPPTDLTPGPKSEDYPRDITVSYNSMADMGRFEKQSAGVNISMSSRVTVSHNTVHGSPRSCVNINDGTWGGHLIEYNDLFDCVKETSDHGPINAWGRDRFWPIAGPNLNPSASSDANQKQISQLDAIEPITVSNNRIWHNREWAIDLDDGCTNYVLKNNLLLNAGIKLRDGFNRTVTNNILVDGSIYEQITHRDVGDTINHNITLSGKPYTNYQSDPATARYAVDNNLFWNNGKPITTPGGTWAANGMDAHSITANPAFTQGSPWTQPAMRDYTVATGSPALALGFTNFPMDRFGTGNAGEPTPPAVTWPTGSTVPTIKDQTELFLGATAKEIAGNADQSATGLPDQNGFLLTYVPTDSPAYAQGLRSNDVIRKAAGTTITDRNSFWTVYNSTDPGNTVTLDLWRNQQSGTVLTLTKPVTAQTYNNTAGVTYTGDGWQWKYAAIGGKYSLMDDLSSTTKIGDSFTYTFNGTGVDLISETYSDEGQIDISIDGVFQKTVDAFGSSRAYQQTIYSISGLTPGQHTIKGVMKTGKYMIVDGFRIHSTPQTLNDNAPGITYTGTWSVSSNRTFGDYGNDVHSTTTNGDSFQYSFTGTGVDYVTEKNWDQGLVDIYLDDVLQATADTTNSTRLTQQTVYSARNLTAGNHTLRVVKKSGIYMLLDRINYIP